MTCEEAFAALVCAYPKHLLSFATGVTIYPLLTASTSTLPSISPKQWRKKAKGERARKNNHFVIPFSYL